MTEWSGIHQFEYRWQPTKDLSLIAGSLPAAAIQPWADRIGLWIRHHAVKAPTESVRYEIFNGGMAALAWRQRYPNAIGYGDRPEASRVLLGPVQLLTPEVAIGVCHAGLPEAIATHSGRDSLSPIDPDKLNRLARARADEFDQLAANEAGLARVIAAALTDRDAPLSVQLPQHVIARPPQAGAQGPLLWGLRRTVWPLLGRDSGRRGWSFSTYEPPLGDLDTGALADIVFRTYQAVQPGLSTRREVLVRPHEPIEPSAAVTYQGFATLLVDAYRYLGGEELSRQLDAVGAEYPSADKRIEGMQTMLWAALPAAALSAPSPQYMPIAESMLSERLDGPPSDADLAPVENRVSGKEVGTSATSGGRRFGRRLGRGGAGRGRLGRSRESY